MGVECDESGFGIWFPLSQICLAAMFPKALPVMQGMVRLNVILSSLLKKGLSSKDQVGKLGPAVCVGSGWAFGQVWARFIGRTFVSEP